MALGCIRASCNKGNIVIGNEQCAFPTTTLQITTRHNVVAAAEPYYNTLVVVVTARHELQGSSVHFKHLPMLRHRFIAPPMNMYICVCVYGYKVLQFISPPAFRLHIFGGQTAEHSKLYVSQSWHFCPFIRFNAKAIVSKTKDCKLKYFNMWL